MLHRHPNIWHLELSEVKYKLPISFTLTRGQPATTRRAIWLRGQSPDKVSKIPTKDRGLAKGMEPKWGKEE